MHFASPQIGEKVRALIHRTPEDKAPCRGVLTADFYLEDAAAAVPAMPPSPQRLDEGELQLGHGVHSWQRFTDGNGRYWRQFDGLGRQFWDLPKGAYMAAIQPGAIERHLPFVHLVSVLSLSPLLRLRGIYAVHAAGAQVQGKGIIFSAVSGGGKSTLALALASQGHALLTDERVFLRPRPGGGYQAASPSDVAKVSRAAKDRFLPSLAAHGALGEYDGDVYIKLAEAGLPFRGQCTVHALCCLEKNGTKRSSWEPLPPARAVGALFPVSLPVGDRPAVHEVFGFLTRFLSETPCFKVSLGTDMQGAVAAIEDLGASL